MPRNKAGFDEGSGRPSHYLDPETGQMIEDWREAPKRRYKPTNIKTDDKAAYHREYYALRKQEQIEKDEKIAKYESLMKRNGLHWDNP